MLAKRLTVLIGAVAGLAAMSAQAALVSTAGGLGVYDTTNNVTWTSNANLMATQATSNSGGAAAYVAAVIAAAGGVIANTPNAFSPSGTYTLSANDFVTSGQYTGEMTWFGAQAWVKYLNATNYGGSNQWALPTTVDSNTSVGNPNGGSGNPPQSSSQLALLFYGGLGQITGSLISTTHNGNYSLFSNVQDSLYWSGTEYSANPSIAWYFNPYNGGQNGNFKNGFIYALAVSPGQVGQTSGSAGSSDGPIPLWALVALGAGLGTIASRRLKKTA